MHGRDREQVQPPPPWHVPSLGIPHTQEDVYYRGNGSQDGRARSVQLDYHLPNEESLP